jgi:hypothetical protein
MQIGGSRSLLPQRLVTTSTVFWAGVISLTVVAARLTLGIWLSSYRAAPAM